jgi:hypothetical protein
LKPRRVGDEGRQAVAGLLSGTKNFAIRYILHC